MRADLCMMLAIGIGFILVNTVKFTGYENLIPYLGIAFFVVGIFDWIRVLIKQIRKAGGWKQWRKQQEKENREAIVI